MPLKVGELTAFINGDNKGLDSTLKDSESKMHKAGSTIGKTAMLASAAVVVAGVAIGGASIKLAMDFDAGARKVSTIADETILNLQQIKDESLELSNEIGVDVNEINEALYQMISATGDSANAFDMVDIAAKAAIGGFTDTTVAVDGLTSVLNSYGEQGAESMQTISDQMLVAQNVGKTTFGEMASSIGKVTPTASALKVSTEELFTSIAVLTKNGIRTAESVTGLKAAYSNILKPTTDAQKAAEGLGLEFTAAHLAQVGWAEFLDEVAEATGGNTEAMAQLFGSVEALNSMLVLTSETGAKDFDETMYKMETSAGATQTAFEKMDEGLADSLSDAMNHLKNTGIVIGEELTPHAEKLIEKLDELVGKFADLSEEEQSNIIQTGLWVVGIASGVLIVGTLAGAISKVITLGQLLAPMFEGVGTAIAAINYTALLSIATVVGSIALVLAEINDLAGLGPEGIENLDEYMDDPYKWIQEQRVVEEGKRYGKHAEKMYGTELDAIRGRDADTSIGGDSYIIDIHDNTISDTMDIDAIGEKLVTRIRHSEY